MNCANVLQNSPALEICIPPAFFLLIYGGDNLKFKIMSQVNDKNQVLEHDKHDLHLTINEKGYDWHQQYITGAEVRELGNIPYEEELFLAIKRPWEDELVKDDNKVDLARPGLEHFFSKKHNEEKLVSIHVNDIERKISRGKHAVSEIKNVGEVPASHELEEVIDGKLSPLDDTAIVLIKGSEQFFSHVRDGSSS